MRARTRTPPCSGSPGCARRSPTRSRSPPPRSRQRSGAGSATACRSISAPWTAPAKMRAWIDDQIPARTSRPAPVAYDNPGTPGSRWYSASPEGLLTGTAGDGRAETLIRWEEIPAWTQPGITASLRDQLLSADDTRRTGFRRRLTAAAHPHSGVAAPDDQEDEQSARQLREAIAATWAAIDAAPPPDPAQLDRARRTYQDTSPVQQTLFTVTEPAQPHDDASRTTGQPAADTRPPAQTSPGPATPPASSNDAPAAAVSAPPAPARQQRAGAPAPAAAGRYAAARAAPARAGTPASAPPRRAAHRRRHLPRPAQAPPARVRGPAGRHRHGPAYGPGDRPAGTVFRPAGQPASPAAEPGKRSRRRRRACASRSTPQTAPPAPGCCPGPRSPGGCSRA